MTTYFTPAQTESTEALHEALTAMDPLAVQAALEAGASTSRKMGSSELNAAHRLLWLDALTIKADPEMLRRHTACFELLLEGGHVNMTSKMVKKYNVYQALDGRWEACARLWMLKRGVDKAQRTLNLPSRRNETLMPGWWAQLLDQARTEERSGRLERRLPQAPQMGAKPRM